MSHPNALRPAFRPLEPIAARALLSDLALRLEPAALEAATDPEQRLALACAVMLEAMEALDKSRPDDWNQSCDDLLFGALDIIDGQVPHLARAMLPDLRNVWSAAVMLQVSRTINDFDDGCLKQDISLVMRALAEPDFSGLWRLARAGYSSAFNSVLRLRSDASAKNSTAIIRGLVPKYCKQLLHLWEKGAARCPALSSLLLERPKSAHLTLDKVGRLSLERNQRHMLRWAILMADMADDQEALLRWSHALEAWQRTQSVENRGPGPDTTVALGRRILPAQQITLATQETSRVMRED